METIENWHGTPGGYTNHKCRCDACRLAWNACMREYKRKRIANNGQPLGGDAGRNRRVRAKQQEPEPPPERTHYREVVPAQPFRMWLANRVQEYSVSNVAATLGISQRRVRTIIDGYYWQRGKKYPVKNLTLDFVDNALVAFGDHLMDLYPDLY